MHLSKWLSILILSLNVLYDSLVDPTMLGLQPFRLLSVVQFTLAQTVLSVPYLITRDGSHLNVTPYVSSLISLHLPNITRLVDDSGIRFEVPKTRTTLYFRLGFPCKESGIHSTINSARHYCEQRLEQEGDGPLPRNEDPFHEDLGYGAAINVVSARPDHRLTWSILKNAMEGLWEFLILDGRHVECEFDICHSGLGLVGRGTIVEAPEVGREVKYSLDPVSA